MLGDTMGYNYDEQYDTWVWLKVEYAIKESQIAALERKMINYWIWGGTFSDKAVASEVSHEQFRPIMLHSH